jgi:hypothetical protein
MILERYHEDILNLNREIMIRDKQWNEKAKKLDAQKTPPQPTKPNESKVKYVEAQRPPPKKLDKKGKEIKTPNPNPKNLTPEYGKYHRTHGQKD